MNSSENQELGDIAAILDYVRRKGVTLWSKDGELRYRAPKGALTGAEIERLRAWKEQITAYLERMEGEQDTVPRRQLARAPLTFGQLSHWNFRRLEERPSVRQLASATRLSGPLDLELLRQSFAELVRRHEALRTRIVVDGTPMQEISAAGTCEIEIDDLTAFSASEREIEVRRLIDHLILEPIDVAVGPLCGVRLARLGHDEHVLLVAMEHIISDAFSMNILLRDLFTIYGCARHGLPHRLPAIPVQFADYALWLRRAHRSWIEKHSAYWNERLMTCGRLKFPHASHSPPANRVGWGAVPLRIGRELKADLRDWCRSRRTTMVTSVFTAYVALVLRWCGASDAVIRYQSDGRTRPEVANTIGFFASILNIRIALRDDDSFLDLLDRVTQEYCNAYEHADLAYLDTRVPQPEFVGNPGFNWVPQEPRSDLSGLDGAAHDLVLHSIEFTHPVLKIYESESEPAVLLYDLDDEIVGGVNFPLKRYSAEVMERFTRTFMVFLDRLLRQPEQRVMDIQMQ